MISSNPPKSRASDAEDYSQLAGLPALPAPTALKVQRRDETIVIAVSGNWLLRSKLPDVTMVASALSEGGIPARMEFDLTELQEWNSGLLNFVLACRDLCISKNITFAEETLNPGLRQLVHLARAVEETKDAQREISQYSFLHRLGKTGMEAWGGILELVTFLGENAIALTAWIRGQAQLRWSDVKLIMQQCGPEALGVVALINFLVGVILAFVGAVQLRQFGASIFVADLVAIGTVREMGCIMTGVILCGRTGAAFAAQLGAMKVNEEIDAFRTFGISPIEFLVMPRIVALLLMVPLLCVFADVIAIFGGFVVSISMLDVTATEYIRRTLEAITLKSFLLGVCKGAFFGVLVAVSGCLRGMQCGFNAAAVGQATTSAVVTGITSIVAADGLFAVLCNALDI